VVEISNDQLMLLQSFMTLSRSLSLFDIISADGLRFHAAWKIPKQKEASCSPTHARTTVCSILICLKGEIIARSELLVPAYLLSFLLIFHSAISSLISIHASRWCCL
jgi:hypothetical protein